MVPFIIFLGAQIENINMKSPKFIIKTITQKIMVDFGFGCTFHDFK